MSDDILEKIVALSDGELSSSQAAEVYQMLAKNPELQEELNYHLKMKNVYKKIEIPPPSHLKSNILIGSGLAYVFWKTKGFIYGLITSGVAVTAFLGYQFDVLSYKEDFAIKDNVNIEKNYEKIETKISLPKLNSEYKNIESSYTNFNNFSSNLSSNQNLNSRINSDIIDDTNLSGVLSIDNSNSERIMIQRNLENYPTGINLLFRNNSNDEFVLLRGDYSNYNVEEYDELKSKLNFTIRKSYFNNIQDLSLDNSQKLDLNNASIALMYEYNDNFHFGLEYNGEEFAQKFSLNVNDSTANYQQFYNTYYFGLAGKYYLANNFLNSNLSFFGKGLIGATTVGPVLRLEIGGEFYLFDKWSIVSALELSSLIYSIDGNINYSGRSGFSTGLKYDF